MVNADRQFKADVLIRDGLIARVGPGLQVCAAPLPALVPATCVLAAASQLQPVPARLMLVSP